MTIKELNTYIDACLIDEYADKDLYNGYTLDVDSLPDHEISCFLDRCMQEDTEIRDFVLHKMQEMIDKRLPEFEAQDRFDERQDRAYFSNGAYLGRGAA